MGMQRNKKILIIGLATVVVIAGSVAGYFVMSSQREKKKVAEAVDTYTDALKNKTFQHIMDYFQRSHLRNMKHQKKRQHNDMKRFLLELV